MKKNNQMKTILLVIVSIIMISSSDQKQTKKKILFFGDSITEQGAKPGGYIKQFDSLLKVKGFDKNYETIGAGISSNKVYDLYLRMDDDVLAKSPDAVVIYIGVNDVWHKRVRGTGTDPEKFEVFYNAIIKKLKAKKISVFLCTPAVIGEKNDFSNESDGDMNRYAGIVRSIANKTGSGLIDLRQNFLDHLKTNNPTNTDTGILTTDGVHLNPAGNRFVAEKMINIMLKDFIK